MDELSRVIAGLMQNLPQEGAPDAASDAPPADTLPPQDAEAAEAALMPSGGDLSGMLGMLGSLGGGTGGMSLSGDPKMQLLVALKPWLRPERCDRIDRLCRLMNTANGVRGALRSMGGMFHV